MNQGKYVFAQVAEFLPKRVFDCIVDRYSADKNVRHFSCWNHMLCMIFGQLTNRDSLRDLILAIKAHRRKTYPAPARLQRVETIEMQQNKLLSVHINS